MKTLTERIAIEQAGADGEPIQAALLVKDAAWNDRDIDESFVFQWLAYDYRIKEEPIVRWFNVYKGKANIFLSRPFTTKTEAIAYKNPDCIKTIKMVEV